MYPKTHSDAMCYVHAYDTTLIVNILCGTQKSKLTFMINELHEGKKISQHSWCIYTGRLMHITQIHGEYLWGVMVKS